MTRLVKSFLKYNSDLMPKTFVQKRLINKSAI